MAAGAAAGTAVPAAAGDKLLFCVGGAGAGLGPGLRAVSATAIGAEALTACRLPFDGAGAGPAPGAGRAETLDSAAGEGSPGARAEALLLARTGA